MIKLTKGDAPEVLVQKYAEWTQALRDKKQRGEKPTDTEKNRYRHRDIKSALIDETHGKCAYCESKVRHIAHGDIEHISPKSLDVDMYFKWENLTLACDVCNENKSNFDCRDDNFVDPYKVDPEDYIRFCGALVFSLPGNDIGKITEAVLKLNRMSLVERRTERLIYLQALLDNFSKAQIPEHKALIVRDLVENELSERSEYCALSRAFVAPFVERMKEEIGVAT